jgi:putative hydrolase of the HAD superfamily
MKKTAIIFDLDNCLAPATAVGEALLEPAFDAVRAVNRGLLDPGRLEEAFADCWVHAFDWVARTHGFSSEMREAGWAVMRTLEVRAPMTGYSDLGILQELEARRFLVTSGFRRLQSSKVRALGIEPLFERVAVDAIDERDRIGKQAIFERILADFGLSVDEVLVVGDNPESEIAAGNRLGITTIQTLRPGVSFSPQARGHIDSIAALKPLLQAD